MVENQNFTYFTVISENLYELDQTHNPIFDPVGEATIQIENGLVKSTHPIKLFITDLNPDGAINHDQLGKRTISVVSIDLHEEVSNCIRRLAQTGYIPLDYICHVSEDKNPEYEATLSIKNWSGGRLINDYFDLYPQPFDRKEYSFEDALDGSLIKAIIHFEGAYSEEWYCALICRIYFSSSLDTDINNIALLGKLIEQMHWKHNHEKHAVRGEKLELKQVENNEKRKARPHLRKEYMKEKAINFFKSNDRKFFLANDKMKAAIFIAEGKKEQPHLFLNGEKHISLTQIKKDYQDIKSEIDLRLREN